MTYFQIAAMITTGTLVPPTASISLQDLRRKGDIRGDKVTST